MRKKQHPAARDASFVPAVSNGRKSNINNILWNKPTRTHVFLPAKFAQPEEGSPVGLAVREEERWSQGLI